MPLEGDTTSARFVMSPQTQRGARPRDTTSARLWCPLANQAPGDVADGVGHADQCDQEQQGKQDDAGLSNHAVDATGQCAASLLVKVWIGHQTKDFDHV